jgi:hypothetical protein
MVERDTLPISTLKIPVPPPENLPRKISQRNDISTPSTDRLKDMMYGTPISHGEKLCAESRCLSISPDLLVAETVTSTFSSSPSLKSARVSISPLRQNWPIWDNLLYLAAKLFWWLRTVYFKRTSQRARRFGCRGRCNLILERYFVFWLNCQAQVGRCYSMIARVHVS